MSRSETFDFLGYTFGRNYSRKTGRPYLGMRPSQKKVQKFCESLSEKTARDTTHCEPSEIVDALNRQLRGWRNYFRLGAVSKAYRSVDNHVTRRLRQWLCAKHKEPSRGTARFPDAHLYESLECVQKLLPVSGMDRVVPIGAVVFVGDIQCFHLCNADCDAFLVCPWIILGVDF